MTEVESLLECLIREMLGSKSGLMLDDLQMALAHIVAAIEVK